MLASITPLGERGRGRSWGRTATAFFLGAAVGGAALGVGAGAVAVAARGLPAAARWPLAAAAAIAVVGLDVAGRLPSWRRQVDVRWLTEFRGWVVGLGYGAQLGAGVVTIVPTSATWLMLLVAIGSGSFSVAAALGLLFGVSRAVPLLTVARVETAEALHGLHRRLASLSSGADRAARAVAVVAACGVVVVATGVAQ